MKIASVSENLILFTTMYSDYLNSISLLRYSLERHILTDKRFNPQKQRVSGELNTGISNICLSSEYLNKEIEFK